jgi:hypothetical protein
MSDTQKLESMMLDLQKMMLAWFEQVDKRFDKIDARMDLAEIWNDKAFWAIEDLRTELKSDGAATRGMIYEAYEQISELRDIIEKRAPIKSPTMNRYPRGPVTR